MDIKELIKGLVALAIMVAALVSLFIPVITPEASKLLQYLAAALIGYYFGIKEIPLSKMFKK